MVKQAIAMYQHLYTEIDQFPPDAEWLINEGYLDKQSYYETVNLIAQMENGDSELEGVIYELTHNLGLDFNNAAKPNEVERHVMNPSASAENSPYRLNNPTKPK